MIRTLIFGAIAGYVGKKLYDEGKLDDFRNDLVNRYNKAKADIADQRTDEVVHTVATPSVQARPLAS